MTRDDPFRPPSLPRIIIKTPALGCSILSLPKPKGAHDGEYFKLKPLVVSQFGAGQLDFVLTAPLTLIEGVSALVRLST